MDKPNIQRSARQPCTILPSIYVQLYATRQGAVKVNQNMIKL